MRLIDDLKVIIYHFDKYPLRTQKQADYLLFKEVFELMLKKEHLTEDGVGKILAIKASINKGLPDSLKAAFPNVMSVERPLVKNQVNPSVSSWIYFC